MSLWIVFLSLSLSFFLVSFSYLWKLFTLLKWKCESLIHYALHFHSFHWTLRRRKRQASGLVLEFSTIEKAKTYMHWSRLSFCSYLVSRKKGEKAKGKVYSNSSLSLSLSLALMIASRSFHERIFLDSYCTCTWSFYCLPCPPFLCCFFFPSFSLHIFFMRSLFLLPPSLC